MKSGWIFSAVAVVALGGCLGGGSDNSATGSAVGPSGSVVTGSEAGGNSLYKVSITRTQYGVPHIKAADFGSLGYGQGYAFAQDNLCVFLNDLITIRGERSRYFGSTGTYTIEPNGSTADNLTSDFLWKSLFAYSEKGPDGVMRNAWERTRDKTIPDYQQVVKGYVAGVNRYIAELKAGQHTYKQPDGSTVVANSACANSDWLQPISEADLYRRFVRLAVLASSSVFVNEIGNAQPPAGLPVTASRLKPSSVKPAQMVALLKAKPNPLTEMQEKDRFGSNMYAFGKDATTDGQSIVYGNPHFPWRGTERLYLSHATLINQGQKKLDIMGVGLYGVPAVLIGFNENVAWSHTVSTAYRFTFYQLQLNPLNPTQYMYDGKMRDMTAMPLEVQVKQADGSLTTVKRTLYRSHFGPMLVLKASGVPVLGWNNATAFTLRDANLENDRLINQFAQWNMAKSLDDFIQLQKTVLGVPWVNTVASGPGQPVYYGDVTVVPNVTDQKVAQCKSEPFNTVVGQLSPGLPVLDGSKSSCEWGTDTDAPAPGIFGASHLPTLIRTDFVHNCNDSYWLTNPAQPLTGYSRIIGDENTQRSLRTRLCILQAQRRLAGTDGLPGNKMDQKTLEKIVLGSELYSATLAKTTVLNTICQSPMLLTSGLKPVQTAQACAALAAWDGRANLDSKGAHLWQEFWLRAIQNPGISAGGQSVRSPVALPPINLSVANPLPVSLPTNFWVNGFASNDPVNTPNGLNVANPLTLTAFADAIDAVQASGFAMDEPLGNIQHSGVQKDLNIPIFGGSGAAGAFTVVKNEPTFLDKTGYHVVYGNSYIQAVTWGADGEPKADALLTYSESTDPGNPHFADYTRAYSAKNWLTLPFTPAQIEASKIEPTLELTGN
ncbi:penicillin acylase family protein [Limnobacter sp.]|uniref:penicillin acylase family protein n=1 Tax=Limnobacter sp. TaxID=2003368 RepID=UPI00258BDDB3|nr:penicillin acylase family protein [Limnobacter sp.]